MGNVHRSFGMALYKRQGTMLANLSHLGQVQVKNPAETRSKLIEIDRMASVSQERTGDQIGEGHCMFALAGMFDPSTRQHTSCMVGAKHAALELEQSILDFTPNMVLGASYAMHIGGFGQTEEEPGQ